jgi:hypothetical protein
LVWASKPSGLRFVDCTTKNRRREVGVGHASRYSGLLRVEASLVMVSRSGLKTGGGAMAGGARGTIMEVESEAS